MDYRKKYEKYKNKYMLLKYGGAGKSVSEEYIYLSHGIRNDGENIFERIIKYGLIGKQNVLENDFDYLQLLKIQCAFNMGKLNPYSHNRNNCVFYFVGEEGKNDKGYTTIGQIIYKVPKKWFYFNRGLKIKTTINQPDFRLSKLKTDFFLSYDNDNKISKKGLFKYVDNNPKIYISCIPIPWEFCEQIKWNDHIYINDNINHLIKDSKVSYKYDYEYEKKLIASCIRYENFNFLRIKSCNDKIYGLYNEINDLKENPHSNVEKEIDLDLDSDLDRYAADISKWWIPKKRRRRRKKTKKEE